MARRIEARIHAARTPRGARTAGIPITKMHGLGNDFVVVDAVADAALQERDDWRAEAQRMCDRRCGVGADGVLIVSRKRDGGWNEFLMRVLNADGSEPEMCGNGLRCTARLLVERDYAGAGPLRIATAGVQHFAEASQGDDGVWTVTVDMGAPGIGPSAVGATPGVLTQHSEHEFELACTDHHLPVVLVSTGNPHAVAVFRTAGLLADVDDSVLTILGQAVERHEAFPNGINAQFVHAPNRHEVHVRTWERGCGITRACGSGACASVVASVLMGHTDRDVTVHMQGGDLNVHWNESDDHILMSGPAERVFDGVW